MIDTKTLLQSSNILKLIETDLGRPLKKSGRYVFYKCPFHSGDNSPSFGVTEGNGRYFCFGCGANGDSISWLMNYHKLSFKEACENLSGGKPLVDKWVIGAPPEIGNKEVLKPLPDSFQEDWHRIVEDAHKTLYSDKGRRALEYLYQRGLNDKTIKSPYNKLGYFDGMDFGETHIGRGIIIPCIGENNYLHYVKVRLPEGKPKYLNLPAPEYDLCGVYGAPMAYSDVLFITEGEFDCLLLKQEAGDLVGVCTLGSTTQRFYSERYGDLFAKAEKIIICLDNDEAGDKGEEKWRERENLECFRNKTYYARVPQEHKDITDFYLAGGDLPAWVMDTLKSFDIE